MGNDQPALRALFAYESGLSGPEIGLEHAFVLLSFDLAKGDSYIDSYLHTYSEVMFFLLCTFNGKTMFFLVQQIVLLNIFTSLKYARQFRFAERC